MSKTKIETGVEIHVQTTGTEQIQRLNGNVQQLDQNLQDIKPSLNDAINGFKDLANLGGMGGGLALVTKEAIEFESAMAQVKKVADGTPEQMAQLSGSLKDLGGQLGMLPTELAQIAAAGGQMGIAFDKLPEFTQMTAQMANAFGISAEQAGEMSAKISNVYGLTVAQMGELGDAINTLGNTTAAKEAEIGNVLMRIGGNAKQFGLLKEEAAALSAAFVSLGKSPEEAGTAINALLTKLQNAKLGTNEFQAGLRELGLSAEEMAANIAQNPQRALDDFLVRLDKLDTQARSEVLGQMFGAEYSDDLALLVGGLDTYQKALENATDKTQTFGAMQKEAGAALATTEGKMKQAKAEISAAMIDLGNALLPVVQAAATAVGGVANAVKSVSEQFPMLSQLAVLFASVKLASMAFGSAMKLAGLEGATGFLKTDVGVKGLKKSILETATAAQALGAQIKAATVGNVNDINLKSTAVKDLGSKLASAAQNAAALYASFEMGHALGTTLREQSTLVRDLGDQMGKVVAYTDALFTDRTFDDVRQHYRTTRQEIREQEQAQKAAAQAAAERAEKEKAAAESQAQKIRELTATYQNQQAQYQANESSLHALTAAGRENGAFADELRAKNQQLAEQLAQTKTALASLNAQIGDTSPFAKNKQALTDLGLTAEQIATGISQSAKKSLDDFALAAQGFGNDADAMAMIFQAAVKKMDSPEALSALKQSLAETGQNAGLTAKQIAQIAATAPNAGLGLAQISKPLGEAETAAQNLGIELQNAFSGSSPAMTKALADFATLRENVQGLAAQGLDTGKIVAQGLAKLSETAQNQADIDALKQAIQGLGQSGALSVQQVENAILAADQKLNQLKQSADPTAQAFEKLGIKTREAMRLSAEETRLAFETVEQSGEAVSGSLKEKFAQVAQDLLATGDANQQAWVQSKAAAYDYTVVIDNSGKMALQAAAQTVQAAQQQVQAHNEVATAAQNATATQIQESEKATQSVENHTRSVKKLAEETETAAQFYKQGAKGLTGWLNSLNHSGQIYLNVNSAVREVNQSLADGANLSVSLAKAESLAATYAKDLGKQTLSKLNNAIDQARAKMQGLADDAANTRKQLEKQLLNAQGNESAVAAMEQQEALDSLQKQLEKAQKMGNQNAVADLQKSMELQRQIYQTNLQKAQQEQQKQQLELSQTASNVNVNVDLSSLEQTIRNRENAVANQAAQMLVNDLNNALSQQR